MEKLEKWNNRIYLILYSSFAIIAGLLLTGYFLTSFTGISTFSIIIILCFDIILFRIQNVIQKAIQDEKRKQR